MTDLTNKTNPPKPKRKHLRRELRKTYKKRICLRCDREFNSINNNRLCDPCKRKKNYE